MEMWIIAALAALPVVALAVLTMRGERQRGRSWVVVALAGVFFPLAWTVWYVCDDLAGRRAGI